MEQLGLFGESTAPRSAWPDGLVYEMDLISREDEAGLIEVIRRLPLVNAKYKRYTARRRVVSFGGSFDYDANKLVPTAALIDDLLPLRERVARWAGVDALSLVHVLVAENAAGSPLGWHRDVPDFEEVIGLSLGSPAVLRFRPYPHVRATRPDIVRLTVAPRSIYLMRGPARWAWQHSVAPLADLRWSITFRTKVAGR